MFRISSLKAGTPADWRTWTTPTLTNAWNASSSGSGTAKFADVGYNGSVGAGQTINFGFQGTGTGQGMTVTSCAAS